MLDFYTLHLSTAFMGVSKNKKLTWLAH